MTTNPMHRATSRRAIPVAVLLAAALALGGCTAMTAQNPSTALKPVNAVADGTDARVLLAGHDVVAYFTQGRHALGAPQHTTVYEGVTLRFASAEHKALFDAEPKRYLPQFGGYCNLKLAEQYWRDEVAGRNSFAQRAYRLAWRVPHYKSGAELAQMVAEAKARAPAQ